MTSCLTGLDSSVLQIKTKIVSSHTADSKSVKQVNGIVILPTLVFPGLMFQRKANAYITYIGATGHFRQWFKNTFEGKKLVFVTIIFLV
jgi:hypothetical protein